MKSKKINTFSTVIIIAVLTMLGSSSGLSAQTRSYATSQILTQGAYGTIAEVPQNQGTWVSWSNDGKTITMSDGTQWRYLQDNNGYHHYSYAGTTGVAMPNTQYNQAVFNHDCSTMAIFYRFGMPGMMIQMRSDWQYIGEGTQPAYDWITGNY